VKCHSHLSHRSGSQKKKGRQLKLAAVVITKNKVRS
jgi:hypothetical protein